MPKPRKLTSPFRYLHSSPEVIRLVVMAYVRFPVSLRNVEYLLFERGIDVCHETVRLWRNRFGPLFAADIRRQRVNRMRSYRQWKWHLELNGEMVTCGAWSITKAKSWSATSPRSATDPPLCGS